MKANADLGKKYKTTSFKLGGFGICLEGMRGGRWERIYARRVGQQQREEVPQAPPGRADEGCLLRELLDALVISFNMDQAIGYSAELVRAVRR